MPLPCLHGAPNHATLQSPLPPRRGIVLPLPSVCRGGKVFGPMDGFGCRLGLPIDLPRPCKAHSLVEAASASAVHRPMRPQGWPVTHCDSAAYVQSSALFAQRIVRNTLIISRMPATQHATHMLHHPPNGLTTSLTTYQTGRPQAEPDTCHTPHPHPPERKNFCGDAETTAFLRKFAL